MPGSPENHHETHIPAFQSPPRSHSRLSRSHEDPRWSRRHQRTPRQGPQAPGCLSVGVVAGSPGRRMQRLKTRAQFQAVMAGSTVSRTPHFALHRTGLHADSQEIAQESERSVSGGLLQSPPTGPGSAGSRALFAVSEPWLGALVPKRWAKRAVTRNAIKRQIYSVSRDYHFPVAAHVVRLRSSFDRTHFVSAQSDALKKAVRAELQDLFAKALA